MKEHKHAEILRAIAVGKEVEYMTSIYEEEWWTPVTANPLTHPQYLWRIKPEPKPPIVRNLCFAADNDGYLKVCSEKPNVCVTFDADTRLPIKVELI